MKLMFMLALALVFSCTALNDVSDKIEASHYALYNQKILVVTSVNDNRVLFTNPQGTRHYYLKGRKYTRQWAQGDTFVIDSNLTSFYKLRFTH